MHIRTCVLALLMACGSSTPETKPAAEAAPQAGQAPAPGTSKELTPSGAALGKRLDVKNMAEAPAGTAAALDARRNDGLKGVATGQYDALKIRIGELEKNLSDEHKKALEPTMVRIKKELESIGAELAKPGADGQKLTDRMLRLHAQADSAVAQLTAPEMTKGQWTNPNGWPKADGEWPSAVNVEDLPPEVREFVEALQQGQEPAAAK